MMHQSHPAEPRIHPCACWSWLQCSTRARTLPARTRQACRLSHVRIFGTFVRPRREK